RRPDDPGRIGEPELITDFMGYNSYEEPRHPPQANHWVGDLMVECEATVTQPGGELVLELAKGLDRFQAHFNLQDGTCTLKRLTGDEGGTRTETKTLDQQPSPVNKPGTYELRFANVDERLLVWVDGKLLFGDGVKYP